MLIKKYNCTYKHDVCIKLTNKDNENNGTIGKQKINHAPLVLFGSLPNTVATQLTTELKHPDVKYLFDMIDFNNFLKIPPDRADHNNCYDWCDKYSGKQFRDKQNDDHPSTEQHLEFTNRIIIPYLKEKAMI